MIPRSLVVLVPLASLFALPGRAAADQDPAEPVSEVPAPEPGAAGEYPTDAPMDVAPPSSDPPLAEGPGTTGHGKNQGGAGGGLPRRGTGLVLREGPFELRPGGILQLDTYGFAGPGVSDFQRADGTGLKWNVAARRARFELAGRVLRRWFFVMQAEYSSFDQRFSPGLAFVGLDASHWLKIQVGQFRVPFMMESGADIHQQSFMERSLSLNALGAPLLEDLGAMAWGGGPHGPVTWALGWFGGGGANKPSTDNRGNLMGRLVFRPLHNLRGSLRDAHVGLSARVGRTDRNYSRDAVPGMRTPGGYELWSPSYGSTQVRSGPEQRALAFELFVPLRRFELRAEALLVRDERREVDTRAPVVNNTERAGTLKGYSFYVEAGYTFFGQPRYAGNPGHYAPINVRPRSMRSLTATLRYEQISLDYDSIARSYDDTGVLIPGVKRGALDAQTTELRLHVMQAAVSYWATRHLRVVLQWSGYFFPEGTQLVPPGARANGNNPDARVLHEIAARFQVSI